MASGRELLASAKTSIKELSCQESEKLMEEALFLDVREADEYEQGIFRCPS